jgi:predicted transcriptional regulator
MSDKHPAPVTTRLPDDLLRSLEELRPLLKQLPEYAAHSSLSRSALLRIAIAHGVVRLRELLSDRLPEERQVDLLENRQESLDVGDDD